MVPLGRRDRLSTSFVPRERNYFIAEPPSDTTKPLYRDNAAARGLHARARVNLGEPSAKQMQRDQCQGCAGGGSRMLLRQVLQQISRATARDDRRANSSSLFLRCVAVNSKDRARPYVESSDRHRIRRVRKREIRRSYIKRNNDIIPPSLSSTEMNRERIFEDRFIRLLILQQNLVISRVIIFF